MVGQHSLIWILLHVERPQALLIMQERGTKMFCNSLDNAGTSCVISDECGVWEAALCDRSRHDG